MVTIGGKIGVEHVAGDMFVSLPKAETIWMKVRLYDFSIV